MILPWRERQKENEMRLDETRDSIGWFTKWDEIRLINRLKKKSKSKLVVMSNWML